ncbi:MAG: 3-phosphoshikimate 1-carboxyvinyltransferase [Candidatus Omnitrophota bacterium]|nr:3-phosphoshikimate 1-carboxyvinyltransferase [Candidatus Omnitrophota bacterium]
MKPFVIQPFSRFRGKILFPGDKAIAHRAAILSSLAKGVTIIGNFPLNKDCLTTVEALKQLGIKITLKSQRKESCVLRVCGKGLKGLKKSPRPIFSGESGTTLRLLLGVLAGQGFKVRLVAARSLSRRPMLRITRPLRMMGAVIHAQRTTHNAQREEYPPITIEGARLKGISYRLPVASAQVKSAILLAGLFALGKTRVIEPVRTRDHTERLLKLFKAGIKPKENTIVIENGRELVSPKKIFIPGDISSAAFFMVLAAITPRSRIRLKKVGLNPSRCGIIRVLKRMGADIRVNNGNLRNAGVEPMGEIIIKSSKLKGVIVKREEIPSLIDELPILLVAASLAKGRSEFRGVAELRIKEADRIKSMLFNLRKMGADITVCGKPPSERIVVRGVGRLNGAGLSSFADHRTAMSTIVAACSAKGNSSIDDISCIDKSFPGFIPLLNSLKGKCSNT